MTVLQNLVLVVLVFFTIVYGDEHNHIVSKWFLANLLIIEMVSHTLTFCDTISDPIVSICFVCVFMCVW